MFESYSIVHINPIDLTFGLHCSECYSESVRPIEDIGLDKSLNYDEDKFYIVSCNECGIENSFKIEKEFICPECQSNNVVQETGLGNAHCYSCGSDTEIGESAVEAKKS